MCNAPYSSSLLLLLLPLLLLPLPLLPLLLPPLLPPADQCHVPGSARQERSTCTETVRSAASLLTTPASAPTGVVPPTRQLLLLPHVSPLMSRGLMLGRA